MSINPSYTDKQLLKLISDGDTAAFETLLSAYHPLCYNTALQILRDETQAKDIVQEAFLKVWLRKETLKEVDNFGGWLRTITVNLVYDHVAALKRSKIHLSKWAAELSLPETAVETENKEQLYFSLIQEALQLLPAKQREAFILIKIDGKSREEAAQLRQVSPETIKTNLERAMRAIRAFCLTKLGDSSFWVILSIILKKNS